MRKIFTFILSLSLLSTYAQENTDYVKAVSKLACNCVSQIDININKKRKSKEVITCIKSSNITYQVEKNMLSSLEKAKDSLSKVVQNSSKDSVNINIGNQHINSEKNYAEIETYLYDNCLRLKEIYFVDNTEHENSLSNKKKAQKFYEQGSLAFDQKNYKKAIKLYRKAVKKDKKFAFAWDNLALSYRQIDQYDKAIECYETSLKLDSKGKMPLMNIAVLYSLKGDFESAIKFYELYRNYYKNDPESYYGVGRLYYIDKDYSSALDNMIQAYILYKKMKSPYYIDAQKYISLLYDRFKEKGELDTFNKLTKKHNLDVDIGED